MKPFSEMGDQELAAALHSLRPEPSPAFAAELDGRAAAGFPRRSRQSGGNPFARMLGWLRNGSRWRLLIPAGGVAVAAVAVALVVVAGSQNSQLNMDSSSSGVLGYVNESPDGGSESTEQAAPSSGAGESIESAGGDSLNGTLKAAGTASPRRDVERGAQIVIGTKPGEVGGASSQAFETVHQYGGVVLNSSTQNGSGAEAEADFELLIPSGKVGDAMAAFSRIGEVVNRHETTTDITAPTVGTSERLQDAEARIEGLLAQLGEATTDSEREAVEAELDSERGHSANLKSKLANLQQRADLSRVTVRIESGRDAVSPGGADENEGWGIGSALDDAGHLLSVAAGVTIVSLAVLSPLLLLALLAWLAGRVWARRARERALT